MPRVLIVDDNAADVHLMAETVRQAGHDPLIADGGAAAIAQLRANRGLAAMLLDLVMPDIDGAAVLDTMAREGLTTPVVLMAASPGADLAAMALARGAADYLVKPASPQRVAMVLANAGRLGTLEATLRRLRHELAGTPKPRDLIGACEAMMRASALAARAARGSDPVLIEGERGTGRSMLARLIHAGSERAARPFLTIDCAELAERQAEEDLFGPADDDGAAPPGRLFGAQGGTLVLDHIGELPAPAQARLAHLLATGEATPPGSRRPRRLNLRVIATTDRRLVNLARAGHLREDLFFRLSVMPIYLPPLRDRRDDLTALAGHFLALAAATANRRLPALGGDALALLAGHDWPGNLAELRAACLAAVLLDIDGRIGADDLPQLVAVRAGREAAAAGLAAHRPAMAPIHIDSLAAPDRQPAEGPAPAGRLVDDTGALRPLEAIEREIIAFAIEHHQGRMTRVARELGIGRSTLYRKLKEHGLAESSDAA